MNRYCWLIVIAVLAIGSCVPPTDEIITEVNMDFSNPELQKLYGHIDRQEVDSILLYTNHPDPAFRVLMAQGLGSIKSGKGIDSLNTLFTDPITNVRNAAVYAVGQSGQSTAAPMLLQAFKNKDTIEVNSSVNATILESIGKTGDSGLLRSLATVSTYRFTDTLLLLGQTRAIYRYGLRGITVPEGTDLMVEYVTDKNYPDAVRLMAAHYLQRTRGISIDEYKFRITEVLSDSNPYIRMSLASTLSKTSDVTVLNSLITQFESDEDYRVKVNILKAFSSYPYIRVIETVLKALSDPNIHIANTAAEYLINQGNSSDATIYKSFIQDSMAWSVKSRIYSAVLNNIPPYYTRTKTIYRNELSSLYSTVDEPYEKASILNALSHDPLNYKLMKELGFAGGPVEKTTAIQGLGRILRNDNFARIFRNGSNRARREIIAIIQEAISSKDEGLIGVSCNIIINADQVFIDLIDDTSFLTEAISNLVLPQEIDAYNSLNEALSRINGETFEATPLEYSHPVDWNIYNSFSDSSIVNVRTNKGLIKIMLFNKLTPGTVSNFVTLANQDFYDGKIFHRVVPNFVIQTGSSRGDGYGSVNYNIRSELPQLYYDGEGYVGMARSGPHTESTQWFITHSPTPHLDGNYTLFGKVIEGMEVVHDIQAGDQILDIIVTNN